MRKKHILLTTVGSAGDILPMLGLGAELMRRGHKVTVLYMPLLEQEIRAAGFDFIPIGTMAEIQEAMNDPNLWHPVRAMEVIAKRAILKYMRPVYDEIARFDPSDTIVLASGLAFGARIAQERLGFRVLTVHLQSSILMSAHDDAELGGFRQPAWVSPPYRRRILDFVEKFFIDRLITPGLNSFRNELDLPPVNKLFSRWMHSPDGVLGLFPDWFSSPQPDWPAAMHQTGFVMFETGFQELPQDVSDFLDKGDAPLVFTAGSANAQSADFFRTAVETSRRLDRRAILLSRYAQLIPANLPDTILHTEWVPMSRLLPRAALLTHHGGIGTTAQALAAGVPQLITPLAHDQFDNANKLKDIGVGDRLLPKQFRTNRAVPAIRRLLTDPVVRENAQKYAQCVDFDKAVRESGEFIETFMAD